MAASEGNGFTADELFRRPIGQTFDDLSILPVFARTIELGDVSLKGTLAGELELNFPLVSSPMDTITEHATAIQMALDGGIGIIHTNLPIPEVRNQVNLVKRYQMGIVTEPECRKPTDPISEVYQVKRRHGFSTILITEDGTPRTKLLGMVTQGHADVFSDRSTVLGKVMIHRGELQTVTLYEVQKWPQALQYFRDHPSAHKLPILKEDGSVAGLITRKDVVKIAGCPNALTDPETGQLRVGAAVTTYEIDDERVQALIDAGVDVLVIDSSQGGTEHQVHRIKHIRSIHQHIPIVAGNVVTPRQSEALIAAGANALRVGMGSGSICTTADVEGIGRPQLSAVYHVAKWAHKQKPPVPVISDGGVGETGDVLKALALGASTVMVGRFIAGCDETPAKIENRGGRMCKRYRGMGTKEAMEKGSRYRYGFDMTENDFVEQGVSGLVPIQGPLHRFLPKVASALRLALKNLGCCSINDLHRKVQEGEITFELLSPGAKVEKGVHDLEGF